VRLEGEDPIALSILLDVSGSDAQLMPDIDDVIAGLSPTFLRQVDRVSIAKIGSGELSRFSRGLKCP
jgi:hypothetical protein